MENIWRNRVMTDDKAERTNAQAVTDGTPQNVKDHPA